MIGRFLLNCLKLAVPVPAMLVLFFVAQGGGLPAPHATNNLALNEKAVAFAARPDKGDPELLVFGSSMALNNIASEAVSAHFGTTNWYDLGAWGLDMAQTCALARQVTAERKPRTVVIIGNLMDLAGGEKRSELDVAPVMELMEQGRSPLLYLRHPAMVYYLRQSESNKIRYSDRANYECLMMDAFGCVALDVPQDRIIAERWEKPVPAAAELDDAQYAALDTLAAVLREAGTRLVYIGSPYRIGVIGEVQRATIAAHALRVRTIIEQHGHAYVDASDRDWPDDLYCDSSHLNGAGALLFTQHVLAKLR